MNEKVRIPEKYKADLEYRFNPDNVVWDNQFQRYHLGSNCILCQAYKYCQGCPLGGCTKFLLRIIGEYPIFTYGWSKRNNKKARAQLRKLNREAGKYITWVKEGG